MHHGFLAPQAYLCSTSLKEHVLNVVITARKKLTCSMHEDLEGPLLMTQIKKKEAKV